MRLLVLEESIQIDSSSIFAPAQTALSTTLYAQLQYFVFPQEYLLSRRHQFYYCCCYTLMRGKKGSARVEAVWQNNGA